VTHAGNVLLPLTKIPRTEKPTVGSSIDLGENPSQVTYTQQASILYAKFGDTGCIGF